MIDDELILDDYGQKSWIDGIADGSTLSAAELLLQFVNSDELTLETVLDCLGEKNVALDISDLPAQRYLGEGAQRLKMEQNMVKNGFSIEKLEDNDPLRLYLQEIAEIPVCGDLSVLAQQHKTTQILELSLGRVVEIAMEFVGYGVLLLDLIQEGSIGVMEAVDSFTGDGKEFESYRDRKIRFSMAKTVLMQAQAFGVGEKLRQGVEDYRSTDERLLAELGRNPTLEEIAEALHITAEESANLAKTLENIRLLTRAKQPENTDLPQEEEQAVEDTAYFQMRQRIAELLSGLNEKDATLLQMRYGLEGGLPMSPAQVAARMGITVEDVVAKETEILKQLRQQKED